MDPDLFNLTLRHLMANLEPHEGLHEVVVAGLPDELNDEQVKECSAILETMLTALRAYASNAFRSQSNN